MQHEMLLLAERLVLAMETISQDVKNMSAYMYDISCGVSSLLNEKKVKECISVVAHDAGQEDSAEEEYSEQCEHLGETSSLHVGDPEHGESSFGDMAQTTIDPYENSDALSSENNSVFIKGIKLEEQSENDVSKESCEMPNVPGNSENIERVWLEVKSEVQSVTDAQDEAYGMHIATSNLPGQSTDYTTHLRRMPEEQARTHQRERAEDASMVNVIEGSEERPHKCSFCGKPFSTRSYLQTHIREHSGERQFKCYVCGQEFTRSSTLSTHMHLHTGWRPYICTECGRAFVRSQHLTHHMRSHTGERPFKCNVCEMAFTQKCHLTHHMCLHMGERPYKCNVCGKAFSEKSNLGTHMRVYTGERPYSCNECGKAFSEKAKVGIHMRTHTGEKPYKCTLCGKAYSQSNHLRVHMRIHTGEKPCKCTVCGREFKENRNLREHVLIHTGEKPHRCTVCGKEFRQRSSFIQHMHTHSTEQSFQ